MPEFVDLPREIHHRAPIHPSHPPVMAGVRDGHGEKHPAGNTTLTSKTMHISMSDHAGTHGDAPVPCSAGLSVPGITPIECPWNLKSLIGRGRFTFTGFPLKPRGGTASPIRAVAMLP